ncbi:MAG: transcription termination factor NusA [Lachnospiraceae bacterium]
MNRELITALDLLEEEKGINKESILVAIENSLVTACQKHYDKNGGAKLNNIKATVDRTTGDFKILAEKTVVENVENDMTEISLENAKMINDKYDLGDLVNIEVDSSEFSRTATKNAKEIIQQKIREEEKMNLFNTYYEKERDLITGVVQKVDDHKIYVNLGRVDAVLPEKEQVKTERFRPTERIKLYVVEVKNETRGPKVIISRTHPELVKRLFEAEVAEVRSGVVEIKGIVREAGSRTKIAVWSNDPNVDPVGACVGLNSSRVNAIVDELRGEKIDIINWSEDPAVLIENALSPAPVVSVTVYDDKTAEVVVPWDKLTLSIGKEGQNVRLAARLTGYKIDIKSEPREDSDADEGYENITVEE